MAFSREVRVGLVMYGGVSLAIYINGVAREFFEAVRGRGVYGLLKHLVDSDVTVDIVSGASAGGINGVFLCHALANDYDFARLASLWREHADIDRLLRPVGESTPPSLFDSEGYYQPRLEEAFGELERCRPEPGEVPSPVEAIDLFVMGTDYHGARAFRPDALGSLLESKEHRAVFRLKHRRDRPGGDFDGGGDRTGRHEHDRALATLCRLTSSFPAAFSPTHVPEPGARGDRSFAAHLKRWGSLERETYFIDGGVLDNKPFTDVIEQIYHRTATRQVDRVLFYVEPDPERFAPIDRPEAPDIVGVIAGSLVGIPRYESIARDLAAIDRRNERLREYGRVAGGIVDAAIAAELGREGGDRPAAPPPSAPYWDLRLRELCESFAAAAGAGDERSASELDEARRLIDGICAADRPAAGKRALLDRYDVEYALRRLFLITYRLYDELYAPGSPIGVEGDAERERGARLLHALNRHIQLLKLIQAVLRAFQRENTAEAVDEGRAVARALDVRAVDPTLTAEQAASASVAAAIEARLWPIFAAPGWLDRAMVGVRSVDAPWDDYLTDAAIEEIKRELGRRCAARASAAPPPGADGILAAVERASADLLDRFAGASAACARAAALWRGFAAVDGALFPLERLSGLREKDPIETVRISPADARLGYSRRQAADKVAGDSLGHFGGFLKRSWRANDILWGRLDARCLLVQTLLRGDRLGQVVASPARRQRIREALGAGARGAIDSSALFPGAGERDRREIDAWLADLLGDDERRRADAVSRASRGPDADGAIAPLLVRASQDGILAEDLAAGRDPDAEGPAPRLETPDERGRFFRESYAVGKESWLRDVATRGLLRTATHTGLVARDAIFSAVGRRSPTRSRLLAPVRRVLGMPLWLGYWFATATRFRSARIAAVVASALLLFIAVRWPAVLRPPGAAAGADVSAMWLAFFVLAPIGWIGLEALVFCLRAGKWASAALAVAVAGVTALVLAGKIELRSPVIRAKGASAPPAAGPSLASHRVD